MRRTGIAHLPLHGGHAPPWLFGRMVRLGSALCEAMLDEYPHAELLRRLSDPYFFQALGCVLGFDWHSSGLTTTVGGALKLALSPERHGVCVAGGKREGRKAPLEIGKACSAWDVPTPMEERLAYASRMSAKVDNSLVQDSYDLYAHFFFFTEKGEWAVVQQGMNPSLGYARRYHWLSESVESYVESPHEAICCDHRGTSLDLTSRENAPCRESSLDFVKDGVGRLARYFSMSQRTILDYAEDAPRIEGFAMPARHLLSSMTRRDIESLRLAEELQPASYEELAALRGIGAKSLRALALISQLVYGTRPDWSDPARFSYAHGGKDGIPYPVDRPVMDGSIRIIEDALAGARLGDRERLHALSRLRDYPLASA